MSFSIDKQSIEELNLMGKFRQGSVYFLFNKVQTRGGEQLLDELFRHPLTDEKIINHRTAVFSFFQQQHLAFPFDSSQVSIMREYIDTATARSKAASYLNILLLKMTAALTRNERFKILIQGIQASISVLKRAYAFANELSVHESPFKERAVAIRQLLESPQLAALMDTDIYKSVSLQSIATFDYLLRNKMNQQLQLVLDFIFETDVNIAVAAVAKERGFNYAKALPKQDNLLRAVELRHPCIENAIGNTINMHPGSNVIFLTGANMAGKSTWMKSIGISVYLAHIGFPVAAASMEFSVREGLYSSINVADNIGLGYSHFYAEVVRVKNAAEATSTGRHLLLMFDELFKGTNVKDAYDGTLAVTEAFAQYRNCLFIVSTHIIEVGETLKQKKNIQFCFMPTIMKQGIPAYTYQLKEGITIDRQGMMIIRNEGILEMIGS
ncbi:MutS-related protein [Pseudobacter ginsenosidimutans]|uniref:MutS-like protein n=1 Tax=Pseudobacter ginsenosidimutans TaxID=661488 RepID=A0A4Q7N3D5_9BACT|nr:DNA mismatch repair protein [Pseudobacter ginsenosidimutans]QEC43825.1 DNA mismatch repair protein [Pseudobacter ginsenosidimutans]RZS75245.1 MutS-like protein [Pseudobacter ginsenosidimutans]